MLLRSPNKGQSSDIDNKVHNLHCSAHMGQLKKHHQQFGVSATATDRELYYNTLAATTVACTAAATTTPGHNNHSCEVDDTTDNSSYNNNGNWSNISNVISSTEGTVRYNNGEYLTDIETGVTTECSTTLSRSNDDGPEIYNQMIDHNTTSPRLHQRRRLSNDKDMDHEYDSSRCSGSTRSTDSSNSSSSSSSCSTSSDSTQIISNDYHSKGSLHNNCSTTTNSTSWLQQLLLLRHIFVQRLHRISVATLNAFGYNFSNIFAIPQSRQSTTMYVSYNTKQSRNNNNNNCHISFRKINPTDKEQIRQLHEQWFPVKYVEDFYDDLVYERMSSTGDRLFTSVGTIPVAISSFDEKHDTNTQRQSSPLSSVSTLPPTAAATTTTTCAELESPHQPTIVACVVGCFINATSLSGQIQKLLITNTQKHTKLFYIMTVGTTIRHQGIGTVLIEQCIQQVLQDPSCGVLYLHVLTTNVAAIQMYERLGFFRVIEIPNYYTIDSVRHNCYLYAKFYHGNLGLLSTTRKLMHNSWTTVRYYCINVPTILKDTMIHYLTRHAKENETVLG